MKDQTLSDLLKQASEDLKKAKERLLKTKLALKQAMDNIISKGQPN